MLTKVKIEQMNENELRTQVLIPLFKEMGFRDVYHYHGGPLEQGKDIIMWKPGELDTRVNYAVVAKTGKVSGKVSGKGSASEVCTQVRQCFGIDYLDPVSSQEQSVNRCWVVSSSTIAKEAKQSINSELKSSYLDRLVEFIDGDMLWELVRAKLGVPTVLPRLHEVGDILDSTRALSGFSMEMSGESFDLTVRSKKLSEEEGSSIEIPARFVFPDTPEGREASRALERHVRTGSPVKIPGQYVEKFQLPESFLALSGPGELGELSMGPSELLREHPLLIKCLIEKGETGEVVQSIEYIDLRARQAGTEEITFDNEDQPVPLKVRLMLNRMAKTCSFTYRVATADTNVWEILKTFEFIDAMDDEGLIRITSLKSGEPLCTISLAKRASRIDGLTLKLLRHLALIQSKTHCLIPFPDRNIEVEERNVIYEVASILENGKIVITLGSFNARFDVETAKGMIAAIESGEPLSVTVKSDEDRVKIMGVVVSLGPTILKCENIGMSDESLQKLKQEINGLPMDASVETNFTVSEGSPATIEYPRWLT